MNPPDNFAELVYIFVRLIGKVLPLLVALAFLAFVWGLTKFIANAGDTKTHEDGKALMKWGLVALFVMLSFTGIIRFAYDDVGFTRSFGFPHLPQSRPAP